MLCNVLFQLVLFLIKEKKISRLNSRYSSICNTTDYWSSKYLQQISKTKKVFDCLKNPQTSKANGSMKLGLRPSRFWSEQILSILTREEDRQWRRLSHRWDDPDHRVEVPKIFIMSLDLANPGGE